MQEDVTISEAKNLIERVSLALADVVPNLEVSNEEAPVSRVEGSIVLLLELHALLCRYLEQERCRAKIRYEP